MEWLKDHQKLTMCLLLLGAMTATVIVYQIGFNTIINILLSLPVALLLVAVIVVLAIQGYGKQTYQIAGAVLTWILIHLLWYKFSPETLILATGTKSFWFGEVLFLCVLALLNKITFGIYIINYVTLGLLFGAVAFQLYFFFAGPEKRIEFREYCDSIYYQNVVDQLEKVNKEATAVPLKMRLRKLEQEAKKDLDPNHNDPNRVIRVKKEIAEIKQQLQSLYPPQPKQPEPEKRGRIVKEFNIPAGNGRNEEKNIFTTGLFPDGNNIQIIVLKGGPAQYRKGLAPKDRYSVVSTLTIANTSRGGEVQFIKHKSAKVRVEIIPRT